MVQKAINSFKLTFHRDKKELSILRDRGGEGRTQAHEERR